MIALWVHLKALIVANQVGVAALAAWALLEWALPRIKFLKANSTVELVANLLKAMLVTRVPLVGKVVAVLATPAPTPAPPPAVAAPDEEPKRAAGGVNTLLPLLFVGALLAGGCHGFKAPSYAVMATVASGADVAAQQLPGACEALAKAAVDSADTRVAAKKSSDAVLDRCDSALATLKGIGTGLKTARDAIHDAPDGLPPAEALPWLQLLLKQYCDAVPLLELFRVSLPKVVC
jgi:hypothetical protein